MTKLDWFKVYQAGRMIDKVPVTRGSYDVDTMRESLIDHDGYDPDIVVRKERAKK